MRRGAAAGLGVLAAGPAVVAASPAVVAAVAPVLARGRMGVAAVAAGRWNPPVNGASRHHDVVARASLDTAVDGLEPGRSAAQVNGLVSG